MPSDSLPHLHLFLRDPVPGRTKTRLAAEAGNEAAAAVARALTEAVFRRLERDAGRSWRLCVWFTPADAGERIAEWLCPAGIPAGVGLHAQPEGDLTVKLSAAAALSRSEAASAAGFIGSDCADFQPEEVGRAFDVAAGGGACLCPAADGGFWLLSMPDVGEGVFDGIPWSTEETAPAVRRALEERGLAVVEGPVRRDVDTLADLRCLGGELRAELLTGLPVQFVKQLFE